MAQIVDYSWVKPSPQAVRNAGYVGAMRYVSYDAGKNLTPGERDGLFAAGLPVGLVWETVADRARAGHGAGGFDAREANRQADGLGWPGDRPIFYAVDFDTGPDLVAPYLDGARGAGLRPAGVYGTYRVIEGIVGGGLLDWGWQCAAWSGDGSGTGGSIEGRPVSIHARLFQRAGQVMGGACDANDVLRDDWGGWHASAGDVDLFVLAEALRLAREQQLQVGSVGDAVRWAQILLNKKLNWSIPVDGIFGPLTDQAVRQFQLNAQRFLDDPSVAVDGVVGPDTWYLLTAG